MVFLDTKNTLCAQLYDVECVMHRLIIETAGGKTAQAISQGDGIAPGMFAGFDLGLLALASIFLAGGYFFIVIGMRHGELSVVGPFRYSGMLWALVIGYLVWGDIPNSLAWMGIALLTGSGLYVVYSERRRGRIADRAPIDAPSRPA